MSQQYTNEFTFVLFQNDKGDNPKRPDYRGKVFINGEEFRLSGWLTVKKDGTGEQYIRGKVERIDQNATPAPAPRAATGFPQPTARPAPQANQGALDGIPPPKDAHNDSDIPF